MQSGRQHKTVDFSTARLAMMIMAGASGVVLAYSVSIARIAESSRIQAAVAADLVSEPAAQDRPG